MNEIEQSVAPDLTSGTHHSYWIDSVEPIVFDSLQENLKADVVIVGGGIAGLSVAYNLVNKGKTVVLVEDGNIGSGETGRTTAHIANAIDDRYYEIERVFGKGGAKLAAESHTAAIRFIEDTAKSENIDCDFLRLSGYLFRHPSDDENALDKEFAAATEAGVQVSRLTVVPELKNNQKDCIEFHDQAQFHPLKYLRGLADAVVRKGGKLYTQTKASKISEKGIETATGFRVDADHIVVATNSPVNNKFVMHLKQYPYRTYVIGATIKKGSLKKALWWDTGDFDANSEMAPYHYVRLQDYNEKYDLLICGGEDHPTGMPEAMERTEESSYAKLEGWTKARFDIEEVVYKWSGQVMEPMDSLGYIGRNPMDKDNVYIVTGDSGNGITHATIAGILITDLIVGNANPWEEIYNPARLHIFKSGKTFVKEFIGGFFQYLKTKPKHADEISLSSIKAGDAQIIQLGKEKYGAYRDQGNDLHVVSATCTHMGCTIRWNKDEMTWDCPCHGSRFSFDGKVLNGPAIEDLVYLKENADVSITK